MAEQTKTVASHFGDKQVTREEFVRQWTGAFGQFFILFTSPSEFKELEEMKKRIEVMAGKSWDSLKD